MRRIVLLGGSNVARGISILVETARLIAGAPAEFLIAMGHGRSYGQRSSIMGRSLPGIAECGLWDALKPGTDRATFALVTDIGNDVGYGAPVPQVADWVESCLARLNEGKARVVMTTLPIASLQRLAPWHFHLARALLFPGRPISMESALDKAAELDDRLRALGMAHGVDLVDHDLRWYGIDPLHIRRRHLKSAWARILSPWLNGVADPGSVHGSLGRWLRLRLLTPQQWWLLGRQCGRPQPAGKLPDGSTLSFF